MTSVLAMPMFDPGAGRVEVTLPSGLTVREIIRAAMPDLPAAAWSRLRVALASAKGVVDMVNPAYWDRIKPREGVRLIVRLAPAGNQLRSILLVVVSIAAVALGQFWAAPLLTTMFGATIGAIGGALVAAGVTAIGTMLVNALVPAQTPTAAGRQAEKPTYVISGYRNAISPGGVVPAPLGANRFAPPFAVPPYTEIVGNDQYIRAALLVGYGQVAISNLRIGDTPIANFTDVQVEIREGVAGDAPLTLTPQQIIEQNLGVELRRDYPRDSAGTPVTSSTPAIDPVRRVTAPDATEAAVVIAFPGGLIAYDSAGKPLQQDVLISIRQRRLPAGAWTNVTSLSIAAKQAEGLFRQYRWTLPARGRYEIELSRVTNERLEANQSDRSIWQGLQSFRPEYPINFDAPLALIGLRIKATHQLNGALDNVSCDVTRICKDWDVATQTWITRPTRNPASLFRFVPQSKAAAFPEPDSGMNLPQIEDWAEFCIAKGLKYDRLHDFEAGLWDVMSNVAAAGRAAPRHDGRKWGVVVDRPDDLTVDHISTANAYAFSWSRTYFDPPDALRVTFLDASNDFASAERIIPFPGQTGDIAVTEEIQLPGKTDAAEIWRETRRRARELLYRPDRFTITQPGVARRATRGDRVRLALPSITDAQDPCRVVDIVANFVQVAGEFEMEAGKSYVCRFRLFDEVGNMTSVLRPVVTVPGRTKVLELTGAGPLPPLDELLMFGPIDEESMDCVVLGVEPGEDMTSILTLIAKATIIDTETDADIAPAWDGRVGGAIDDDTTAPAVPVVTGVTITGTGFTVLLEPGASSPVTVTGFAVRHRLVGSPVWLGPVSGPAGGGALTITGYGPGDSIEWQPQAISAAAISSLWGATVTSSIPVPESAPDPFTGGTVTAGLGFATLLLPTPDDVRIDKVLILRGPTSDPADASIVAERTDVLPASTYSHIDGDATATNILVTPDFADDANWLLGDGWVVAGGMADKAPGDATAISQFLTLTAGKTYRYSYRITDRVAGSVAACLFGGTDVIGDSRSSETSQRSALVAATGNTAFGIRASALFEGSVDDAVLFAQSPTHVAQGVHHYFLVAVNAEGEQSAPYALAPVTII